MGLLTASSRWRPEMLLKLTSYRAQDRPMTEDDPALSRLRNPGLNKHRNQNRELKRRKDPKRRMRD